jgi:hypothetical protein
MHRERATQKKKAFVFDEQLGRTVASASSETSVAPTDGKTKKKKARANCFSKSYCVLRMSVLANNDDEVLLRPNPGRFVILPIKFPEIWDFYK